MSNPEPFNMDVPYENQDMELIRQLANKKVNSAVEYLIFELKRSLDGIDGQITKPIINAFDVEECQEDKTGLKKMRKKNETRTNEKRIRFKSKPENFAKEEKGLKSNTIRFTDDWTDERWNKFHKATIVTIQRTTDNKLFHRPIKDKTIYGNIAIISW